MVSPIEPFPTIRLYGMTLARLDARRLLDHVFETLAQRRGGWLITANLDFLRRFVRDPEVRELYADADITVADGMPLVWAARLQGDALPERIAGSTLVSQVAERAAREDRSLYLLGGAPGTSARAARVLSDRYVTLRIVGTSSPQVSDRPAAGEVGPIMAELDRVRPDIVLVGLSSPKAERLIQALRPMLPGRWLIGVGFSFSFLAGDARRAPDWMQRAGLEWLHRLMQEPRRLARRYLVDDVPFALALFVRALRDRRRRRLRRSILRIGRRG